MQIVVSAFNPILTWNRHLSRKAFIVVNVLATHNADETSDKIRILNMVAKLKQATAVNKLNKYKQSWKYRKSWEPHKEQH